MISAWPRRETVWRAGKSVIAATRIHDLVQRLMKSDRKAILKPKKLLAFLSLEHIGDSR